MAKTVTPNINNVLRGMPVNTQRGAPLGARNYHETSGPLHLQRLVPVDGDYGADGTYWGFGPGSPPVWCAFNGPDGDYQTAHGSRIYVRGRSRAEAAQAVLEVYPDVKFKMKAKP